MVNWIIKLWRYIYPEKEVRPPFKELDYFANWSKIIHERKAQFSVGGETSVLFDKNVPIHRRIQALGVTAEMSYGPRNVILRSLLPENLDELRLLAFQLLEGQEKRISKQIDKVSKMIKKTSTPFQTCIGDKYLAQLYFELYYQDLLQPELKKFMLNTAFEHAKNALVKLHNDPALWGLIAKMHFIKHEYEQANKAFYKAMELEAVESHTYPYLAEEAFKRKDFQAVRDILASQTSLLDIHKIGPVVRFWLNMPKQGEPQ